MPRDIITLKKPASWEKDMWRTALPIGCGITGGLIFGAIEKEQIIITRHDLWHKRQNVMPLPDITESFKLMREAIDKGEYHKGCHMMENALREKGYAASGAVAFPLGSLKLSYVTDSVTFRHYRRGIDMASALSFVSCQDERGKTKRECFISRETGILYCRIKTDFEATYEIDFDAYDNLDGNSKNEIEKRKETLVKEVGENGIFYASAPDGGAFGAMLSVSAPEGKISGKDGKILFSGKEATVKLLTFVKKDIENAKHELLEALSASGDFDEAFLKHKELHKELYERVSVSLTGENDEKLSYTNEELLDDAYEDEASDALIEKLWRFGRYLFISAMHDEANPFQLYGLWPGAYCLPWSANVCNENVQCMYWHTLSGGLSESIKNLIDYYYKKMPDMRDNAKKLFGCRGIFVPTYTYPETLDGIDAAQVYPIVPVTLNWISGAGWLSKHFYDYYIYTKDFETLKEKILPFMIETARFYEDYITYDKAGKMRIYPSVSPENTPGNLMDVELSEVMGHACPAVENSTMDFAIMKMHLGNLLKLINECYGEDFSDKQSVSIWKKMLSDIPPYEINEDGAVTEWMKDSLSDNYDHRHFSHLFPVFPGGEVTEDDGELFEAFRKAAELRIEGAMSGWSFPHLALINTRFGDGNAALSKLIKMTKGIVLDNFFTLHNDWRHMGVGINVYYMAPVQLDALMGTVAVIQDMLFQYNDGVLHILPAKPDRIKYVKAENFTFPGGKASFELKEGKLRFSVTYDEKTEITVKVGNYKEKIKLAEKGRFERDFEI